MKEANKGLVDKAIGAIKAVIETILKLKDMLLNVLAKAAGVIGNIISAPIKFLGNLVGGLKQGLTQFMSNIGEHLKKGLLGWLFGALGEAGLTLPEKFDLKGILHIIMQILGLTYSHIRGLAVGIVGEEVVTHLEKSLEFFQVLIKEGPAGLWKWIVEKLSELKATVMDKIKEFIQEKVIIAGIMWLIGLLNPVAAFIKACKAIYDIVKFFIERAGQVMELVNAILDSVGAIASGALGEAAGKVEDALGKAIPVAIGFLASLLGLGGISDKIRSIIQAIQEPIHNVISKVLGVVLKPFKWIGNKIKQGAGWAKKKLEQGVTYVKDKAKAGAAYVKGKAAALFGKAPGEPDRRTDQQKQLALSGAVAAAEQLMGRSGISPDDISAKLPSIRSHYGLTALELVHESGSRFHVHAKVNPEKDTLAKDIGAQVVMYRVPIPGGGTKEIECISKGNTLIPLGKVTIYAMGKVPEPPEYQEFTTLKSRPRNTLSDLEKARLKELTKASQSGPLHNYMRSRDMMENLVRAGGNPDSLPDAFKLIDGILKEVESSGEGAVATAEVSVTHATFDPTKNDVRIESRWRGTGTAGDPLYLTTIILATRK
jgi:hypothetical protein